MSLKCRLVNPPHQGELVFCAFFFSFLFVAQVVNRRVEREVQGWMTDAKDHIDWRLIVLIMPPEETSQLANSLKVALTPKLAL